MAKEKVLFICVHNSARSQMAAALLNKICHEYFEAHSAGLQPGTINPLVVETLRELGIDISKNTTQRVFDVWKSCQIFHFVITVCGEAEAEGCPIFPGLARRLHWPFEDPSKFAGTHDERLEKTRRVRDQIRAKLIRSVKNIASRTEGDVDAFVRATVLIRPPSRIMVLLAVRQFTLAVILVTALFTSAARLPSTVCPVASTPIAKACQMGCCASKCCCVNSQKNHNLPSIPAAKDSSSNHELVALSAPNVTTVNFSVQPVEVRPVFLAINLPRSVPRAALLCTFLI